ncbi:MAG TPA: hypothetical protein VM143_04530 [Acidimicrobiales bacterium]|nr:hypothetical protein [Acidimicrobiales bacterium]
MKKLLMILVVAMLVFSGCGGGDDKGGDSVDSASDDTGDSSSTTADTDFSGKGGGDFCDLAKQYQKDFEDTSNTSNSADDTKKQFQELTAAIKKLVSEAPGEIKDDTKVVSEVFQRYDTLLQKYDYDFAKIPQEEAAKINFEDPKVSAASNRVESYFEKVCKIDSDGDGDTDGVIGDSSTTTAPEETTETTEE